MQGKMIHIKFSLGQRILLAQTKEYAKVIVVANASSCQAIFLLHSVASHIRGQERGFT
jgi:hypothetical protein